MTMNFFRLRSLVLSFVLFGPLLFASGQSDDTLCGEVYYEHNGGPTQRDPVAEMGGLQNIDKIIAIEIDTAHNLLFCSDLRVIGKFITTYRLKDGTTRRIGYGAGGHCQDNDLEVINIPEGVYLTEVRGYDGEYLAWAEFHLSNGNVFRPFIQQARSDVNFELGADRAVIKALTFQSGNVVDGIGAYYEYNGVLRYEMGDDVVVTKMGGTELKDNGVNIEGSDGSLNVFDNIDGDTTLTYDETVTENVREWETRTVTSKTQTDVTFNINIQGIYKGVKAEADFFVGHSTSEVVEDKSGFDEEKSLSRRLQFDVAPGTKKIVRLSYRTYDYHYVFSGTAQCVYQFDPNTLYPGGVAEGELLGSESLSGIEVEIDTEFADGTVENTASTLDGGDEDDLEEEDEDESSGNSTSSVRGIVLRLFAMCAAMISWMLF